LDDLIKYLVYEYSLKYYYFEKVNYSIEFVEHIEQEINLKLNNFLNESSPLFFEKQQIVKVDKKFFTLSLNKIDFSYPNSKFNLKIDNFDFEPGITYGIYGTNSSGKSTLFNIIGGHLNANKGEVLYHKINIDKIRKNDRYISTVFQELALFKHLSVRKNILMGLHSYKKMTSIDSMSALAEELERAFLIYEYRKMKPSKLSGGNKQKTSICRSLIMKPDILLLDEPTSSIDQDSILVVNNTIKKFRTNWNIVIVISHDSDFLKDTCDEIIDMKHGKLILRK
jgi:ABC-type multidrug transport system ATPase subunit